jgi:hypothetical protein
MAAKRPFPIGSVSLALFSCVLSVPGFRYQMESACAGAAAFPDNFACGLFWQYAGAANMTQASVSMMFAFMVCLLDGYTMRHLQKPQPISINPDPN